MGRVGEGRREGCVLYVCVRQIEEGVWRGSVEEMVRGGQGEGVFLLTAWNRDYNSLSDVLKVSVG